MTFIQVSSDKKKRYRYIDISGTMGNCCSSYQGSKATNRPLHPHDLLWLQGRPELPFYFELDTPRFATPPKDRGGDEAGGPITPSFLTPTDTEANANLPARYLSWPQGKAMSTSESEDSPCITT